jgi:protein MpaA
MSQIGSCHNYQFLIKRWRILAKKADLKIRKVSEEDGMPCYELCSVNDILNTQLYVSAGIHGDEPAGTEALLAWAEKNYKLLSKIPLVIYPCLNPWGLIENSRLNVKGKDLNRSWDKSWEVIISEVIKRSEGARFRLAINLHEDYDANGIYLYEPPHGKKSDDLADKILSSGRKYIPIDTRKKIEGRWARNGVIRPAASSLPKEGLPEAAFLQKFRSDRTFVFETPSEYDLRIRVQAQVAMLERAVSEIL